MSKIFISYRRDDSAPTTGRIYDRLVIAFGKDTIFKDVDNIPYGANFPPYVSDVIGQCTVLLAIIGPGWIEPGISPGMRRLDDSADFVRIEIETALHQNVTVIPVLVQGASMPTRHQLPASLQRIADVNALQVRNDPDFSGDVSRLQATLARWAPTSGSMQKSAVTGALSTFEPEVKVPVASVIGHGIVGGIGGGVVGVIVVAIAVFIIVSIVGINTVTDTVKNVFADRLGTDVNTIEASLILYPGIGLGVIIGFIQGCTNGYQEEKKRLQDAARRRLGLPGEQKPSEQIFKWFIGLYSSANSNDRERAQFYLDNPPESIKWFVELFLKTPRN